MHVFYVGGGKIYSLRNAENQTYKEKYFLPPQVSLLLRSPGFAALHRELLFNPLKILSSQKYMLAANHANHSLIRKRRLIII
jgi:hypothetical protein